VTAAIVIGLAFIVAATVVINEETTAYRRRKGDCACYYCHHGVKGCKKNGSD